MTSTFRWLGGGLAAALLLGFAGLFGGGEAAAQQPPGPPHQFDGSASVDGATAAAGTSVIALIDGHECGAATVDAAGMYRLHVPATCAEDGDTVNFHVGDQPAAETGTYAGGARTALNLTATTPVEPDPPSEPDGDMDDACPDDMGDGPAEPGMDDGPAEPGMDDGPAEPGMDDGDMDDCPDDDVTEPGGDMHDDNPMVGDAGSGLTSAGSGLTSAASAPLAALIGAIALAAVLGGTAVARRRIR